MAHDHPFQHLFESLARPPAAHAELVNRRAYEEMADLLSVPTESAGRCILLRATRAGHGKTHLLSRLRNFFGVSHEFIPLHPAAGCRIDAGTVIDDTLRCLLRQLPASGGLCVLDLVARRLFASALQPLVASGEVPCQDREGALAALRLRPVETFDFHHPTAVTAHWAKENFEILGQRLSQELAQRCGLPVRGVAFWVDTLFRFASASLDHSGRVTELSDAVPRGGEGEMERLAALLGLVSQLMRVVLVADDVEGFSSDETAALRFAAFLGSLRESVQRLDVILSINRDIWESGFLPRLSDGLADRLSEVVVELDPLNAEEMLALLESRTPGLGDQVLERIDLSSAGTHARGLIRAAGIVWQRATAATQATASAPPVVELPAQEVRPSPPPPPAALPPSAAASGWPGPGYFPPPPPVEIVPAPDSDSVAAPVTPAERWNSPALDETDRRQSVFENVPIEVPVASGPAQEISLEAGLPEVFVPEESPQQSQFSPPTEALFHATVAPVELPSSELPRERLVIEDIFQAGFDDEPPLPATEADTERVDDLLRQFRERYGRGSL
jgi:hypothetical protein